MQSWWGGPPGAFLGHRQLSCYPPDLPSFSSISALEYYGEKLSPLWVFCFVLSFRRYKRRVVSTPSFVPQLASQRLGLVETSCLRHHPHVTSYHRLLFIVTYPSYSAWRRLVSGPCLLIPNLTIPSCTIRLTQPKLLRPSPQQFTIYDFCHCKPPF
jgi:hypothetical protein